MKLELEPELSDSDKVFFSVEITDIKFGHAVAFGFPDDLDTYEPYDGSYASVSTGEKDWE